MKGNFHIMRASLMASCAMLLVPQAARAQEAAPQPAQPAAADGGEMGDIVVTARKRSETLISVPVAITAVTASELSRNAINSTDALARMVPGLIVGEGGGTVQGGSISLRGISAADSNPLGDQAVSFNIDGVQVARSSVRRMGEFDLASVEVLKGPQALFFGKNSPGGIISERTADPTNRLEAGAKVGYEFNAREVRGEGYISGPLADGIGGRLAFYGSTMKGWVKNLVPATDPYYAGARTPKNDEYAFRGTLKYDKGGPFRARFKLSYNDAKGNSSTANVQTVDCPNGPAFAGGPADCKGDDYTVLANLGPDMGNITKLAPGPLATAANPAGNPDLPYSSYGDGTLTSRQKQWLSGLELNYDVAPDVTLTSVTGYYNLDFFNRGNFTQTNRPDAILGSVNLLRIREISEELRAVSSFSGPLNFTVGGQYQDSRATSASLAAFGAVAGQPSVIFGLPSPLVVANYDLHQKGRAYSFYGQLLFKPIEQIEIDAGGRYSHERKELTSVVSNATQLVGNPVAPYLSNGNNVKSFNNFSPEVTVSYRPTHDLTIYGDYKQGFLSGGFNGGSANAAADFSYLPQKVKGFEAGVKGRFLDGLLSADLALYSYKINDLQVQVTVQGTIQQLLNAGKVSSKGAELALTLRPAHGLSLYGNIAYADAKYDQYFANCYAGQLTRPIHQTGSGGLAGVA